MRPRVGCLGLGWIGEHRLRALLEADLVDVVALADPDAAATARVAATLPGARAGATLDDLLAVPLDAVVIASPSALHADQSIACLDRGLAVFCQKPLARSAREAEAVVEAARRADRLLGVDLSYRETEAALALRGLVEDGRIGRVYAADFTFHNAYGPGKEWYFARQLAGGGCVMDLGIHLVDQLLWLLGWPTARVADSRLFQRGMPWSPATGGVEDLAAVTLEGLDGAIARVTCSWHAPAGREAEITMTLFGTSGGARFRNVDGSFYDFAADHLDGTRTTTLVSPPDAWGGRAIVRWGRALAAGGRFDEAARQQVTLSAILDDVYAAAAYRAEPPSRPTATVSL